MFNLESIPALNLNQSTIATANNLSMFDAGDVIARDAENVYRAGLEKMVAALKDPNEEQQSIISERLKGWRELCEKSFNDELHRRASWVPWTVSGPANYPAAKMNKTADRAMEAAREWSEKRARFIENTLSMLRKATPTADVIAEYRSGKNAEPISSDDPAAVEKLSARIEYLKELHEEGKARNAHFRKHHTMKGYKNLTDEEAARQDAAIESAFLYHVPYAPYEVSNMNQNIKRLESRLNELLRARDEAKAGTDAEQAFDGFSVNRDASACRINIYFDAKPDAETRNILKSNGFHWSPREVCWTRKDTPNARYTLDQIVIPALTRSAG